MDAGGPGVLFDIWLAGPIKITTGLIYETESAYNYIQVLDINGIIAIYA